jgi:peroxiredoxin
MKFIRFFMKKLFIVFSFAAFLSACSTPDSFVIKGEIEGKDNEKVALMKFVEGRWSVEDTTRITNGEFELNGSVELPEMRAVMLGKKNVLAQFFAENGVIKIKADADSIDNAEITGSSSNDEFTVFTDEMKRFSKEVNILQNEYNSARMSRDEERQNKARIDFEAMIDNQRIFAKNYIRENISSTTAPFVALWQLSEQLESKEIDELIASFDPSISNSIYITQLKKKADEKRVLGVGAVAPDFTMNNQEGQPVALSSLRGKVVLIDFWASWCQPCRHENPNVVKLYNEYKEKGFDIIGVSLDRDKKSWIKAIEDDQLEWNHVSDLKFWDNVVAKQYKVKSIPHTVLVDKDGKIIAKNLKGEQLAQKLAEILN